MTSDADLLAAAIQKAGDLQTLARHHLGVDRVTVWRWVRDGRIPKARDRALVVAFLQSEAA